MLTTFRRDILLRDGQVPHISRLLPGIRNAKFYDVQGESTSFSRKIMPQLSLDRHTRSARISRSRSGRVDLRLVCWQMELGRLI